jgi:hypothetical protein
MLVILTTQKGNMLFIDANQYLQLYRTVTGRKLLAPLQEQQAHIFITTQIVNEVHRNKLEIAARFLQGQLQPLCLRSLGLPDRLFGIDEKTFTDLRRRTTGLCDDVDKLKDELENLAAQTLRRISRSEDEVSVALEEIFRRAVPTTNEALVRARSRREIGNPPGKKGDPLGDQLSWELFISHAIGRPKLWVISNDSDYLTTFGQTSFLNPFLLRDLQFVCGTLPEVYCFNNLMKGLEHFVRESGVPRGSLPIGKEAAEIEEDFLANYFCGNLYLTHIQEGQGHSVLLGYSGGVWSCPKLNLVIHRDRVIVDGEAYPVQSLRPFYADFVHNGQRLCITQ